MFEYFAVLRVAASSAADPASRAAAATYESANDDLRAQQDYESFRQGLKTWLFSRY